MSKYALKPFAWIGLISWCLAAVFFLYEFFLRVFPGTIAQALIQQFHLGSAELALLGSAYYATYAILQIPTGYLLGKYGVKKVVIVALGLCLLGNLAFVLSNDYWLLMLSRILMGCGSAAAFPSLLIIAREWFDLKYYGFLAGMTQILGALGPILAGVPLVLAAQYFHGWQPPLFIVFAVGCGVLLLCILFLKDKTQYAKPLKIYKNLWEQLKTLFKIKEVKFVALYAFLIYTAMPLFGAIWGVLFMQSMGLSHTKAATVISAMWLGLAFGSPVIGSVSDMLRKRKEVLCACSVLGFFASTVAIYFTHSYILFMVFFFLLGVAGGGQTLSFVVMEKIVPKKLYPCAVGVNNAAVMFGGMLFPVLVGFGFDFINIIYKTQTTYILWQYRVLLSVAPIVFVLSFFIALFKIPSSNNLNILKSKS